MKRQVLFLLTAFLLAACQPGTGGNVILATYEPVANTIAKVAPTLSPTAAITPEPSLTPTPFIHVVALGETFSSIALRYGVSIADVQAANPEANPNLLIVGDELVIPGGSGAPPAGFEIEPLLLEISQPDCFETIEEDWWCVALVINSLETPAVDVSVRFTMTDGEGGELVDKVIPTALNRIDPGQNLPAALLLDGVGFSLENLTVAVETALPADQSAYAFFTTEQANESVNILGNFAQASVNIKIDAPEGTGVFVRVLALAYDANERLVGFRYASSEVQVKEGGSVNHDFTLYSAGGVIETVRFFSEAYQVGS
jgi:LysM repeat protein